MTVLLTARELSHAYAARPLFSGIGFTLYERDRVGLIGPNGAGKSTLLRVLSGAFTPDSGEVAARNGLRVGYLEQTPSFRPGVRVREAVVASLRAAAAGGATVLDWQDEARVDALLAKLGLLDAPVGADAEVATLSGGWQKRVALARELVLEPDLLLLDEPTNHLDVESIEWLERLLSEAAFAVVTVTHDRFFLQQVARRILELDRRNPGGLFEVAGDYATYCERKAEAMQAQEKHEQALRNKLRRETEWLRRGPSARGTKQRARIERAAQLDADVSELADRNRTQRAAIALDGSGRRTRKLIDAAQIEKRYGDRLVFAPLDLTLRRDTRIALLGPNGCGKSTLLRVLTGQEPPSAGRVVRADGIRVQVFEQQRESLEPEATVADTVAKDGDFVEYRGARLHRFGYLERFRFRKEQMLLRVRNLSGGEQSRLLIARLMLKPADVLVLDEPTNDLDFDTLDVLQEALVQFEGAVLLVSHDRYFVDQVASSIVGFHTAPGEQGKTSQFADLSQWQAFHASQAAAAKPSRAARGKASQAPPPKRPKKLSYKDQRDWDTLETRITESEAKLAALETEAAHPDLAHDPDRLVSLHTEMHTLRESIDALYMRWAELESLQQRSG